MMFLENTKVSKLRVSWTEFPAQLEAKSAQTASEFLNRLDNSGQPAELLKPEYFFTSEDHPVKIGMKITLKHSGKFRCTVCDKEVKKLFGSYCYPCFTKKACADRCMMSPHLCHYMAGTCREPSWGEEVCYTPHFVYVAFTDKYKVGITRAGQVPTRWIDQGAVLCAVIAQVTSRHQAGVLEKLLTETLSDKSHWSKMLKQANQRPTVADFDAQIQSVKLFLKSHPKVLANECIVSTPPRLKLSEEITYFEEPQKVSIEYPLTILPAKILSENLDKTPELNGTLIGIKGQYLIFENFVFNYRRHEGYIIDIKTET